MHNLFIVGNGFDLAHGLRSSYKDFLLDLMLKVYDNPKEYKQIGKEYYSKLPDINGKPNVLSISKEIFNHNFFQLLALNMNHQNWNDIEYLYFRLLNAYFDKNFMHKTLGLDFTFKSVKEVNMKFEDVKSYLSEYLEEEQKETKTINAYKELFNTYNSQTTTILNFNYTNTVKKYVEDNSSINLINIHGELKKQKNPIIFGYAANDIDSKKLLNKNDNEFLRNIKRTNYHLTDNEFILKKFLHIGHDMEVHILGHSCGVSDSLILDQIFNHTNIKTIRIYYHNMQEGYWQTATNINRIIDDFSKDKNEKDNYPKLLTYPQSHPMVQHNSTSVENQDFINYVISVYRNQFNNHKNASTIILGNEMRNNRY